MIIPDKFYDLIKRFLEERKTGKITLNIKDGTVLVIDFQESHRL